MQVNGRWSAAVPGNELSADTVAVVLAGGQGARLGPLTRHVCKPALPFGALYRNIDFSIANCVNSGVRCIGVATQYKPETLIRHLGQAWGAVARRRGEFLGVWPAEKMAPATGYRGTADAVWANLDLMKAQGRRLVLVLAGDHVYQMDYRPMLAFHRQRRAAMTIGCVEVPAASCDQFGVLRTDSRGLVQSFVEKPPVPKDPGGSVLASMGIYVFDMAVLARVLRADATRIASHHDFGADIIPAMLGQEALYAFRFTGRTGSGDGYWRDVGTPAAYWRAHLELLADRPALRLDDPAWPMTGPPKARRVVPGSVMQGARVHRSLIAADCNITGAVERSVLFAGASIGAGSLVEHSIVLPGASVGKRCRLSGAIVDSHCAVPDGTVIDVAWRRDPDGLPSEPVVLTADDFLPGHRHAYA